MGKIMKIFLSIGAYKVLVRWRHRITISLSFENGCLFCMGELVFFSSFPMSMFEFKLRDGVMAVGSSDLWLKFFIRMISWCFHWQPPSRAPRVSLLQLCESDDLDFSIVSSVWCDRHLVELVAESLTIMIFTESWKKLMLSPHFPHAGTWNHGEGPRSHSRRHSSTCADSIFFKQDTRVFGCLLVSGLKTLWGRLIYCSFRPTFAWDQEILSWDITVLSFCSLKML